MSSDTLSLVEKFPSVTREECDRLLQFARATPLHYGAWKAFKLLFKKAEAELPIDSELLGVLLARIDGMSLGAQRPRWKAVEQTHLGDKSHSVSGGGFTYTVGSRSQWYDSRGWRLVITSDASAKGVLSGLRKLLNLSAMEGQGGETVAFEFEARDYIHQPKKIALNDGELTITTGSSYNYRGAQNVEFTFVVDISDPNFIHLREAGPKLPTLQYMKRRARRVLRDTSRKNPQSYLQLATQFFIASGDKALDPALNWAAMDVLFAQSSRWHQPQAGRGPYRKTAGIAIKRREERAPELWNAHLEFVRDLLSRGDVPLQTNEMALKILRDNRETPQVLMREQLARFLTGNVPLLQSFATRELARLSSSGEVLDGETWARLMLLGNARTRSSLIETQALDAVWNEQAALLLSKSLEESGATKKRRAASLLVARFANSVSDEILWRNLESFADSSGQTRAWLLERVRQSAQRGEFARLSDIAQLRPDLREMLTQAFGEEAVNASPTLEQSLPLVAGNDQESNATGWKFLAATAMSRDVARELWRRFLGATVIAPVPPGVQPWHIAAMERQAQTVTPVLYVVPATHETAAQSDGARRLFERAEFDREEIEALLATVPAFVAATSPAFFASIFRRLAPAAQIEQALAADEGQWRGARDVLMKTLQNVESLGAFWNRVLERVTAGEDEALSRRILDDEAIAATFVQMPKDAVTDFFSPPHMVYEPYLLRWLQANAAQLGRSDLALLASATHPSGAIRALGLARVGEVGLDLPLALRLMESGLPQPFDLARNWFQSNTELDFADRALALCDSPDARVRAFGREFLESHGELLDAKILQKISESSDPIMQAWLAEHLLLDSQSVDVADFDRAVLKTRGRARRAKEAVKKRLDTTKTAPHEYSYADTSALLDVARSRTARDRDWALQQLARAALAGVEIEGVEVRREVVLDAVEGAS